MKPIHFLAAGAVLVAALQLLAGDTLLKPDVSAAEAAGAVRQQRQPLVSLTGSRRLCQDDGACDLSLLKALGIPAQQHAVVAAAVRAGWQTLQKKFMVSASSKVLDGVHPVTFSGVLQMDVSHTAASMEVKLSVQTSWQTAILVASLFESQMTRDFCQQYKVTYYDSSGIKLDIGGGPRDAPAVAVEATGEKTPSPAVEYVSTSLQGTKFSGLEIRLAPDRVPAAAPARFHFSMDYKW